MANRGHCPLTRLVEDLGADSGRVSDIFLPRWFADRIPQRLGWRYPPFRFEDFFAAFDSYRVFEVDLPLGRHWGCADH